MIWNRHKRRIEESDNYAFSFLYAIGSLNRHPFSVSYNCGVCRNNKHEVTHRYTFVDEVVDLLDCGGSCYTVPIENHQAIICCASSCRKHRHLSMYLKIP